MRRFKQFMVIFLAAILLCASVPRSSPVTKASEVIPKKITLNHNVYTLKKGKKLTLINQITPSEMIDEVVSWKSSKKKVAKVNKKGVVTAKKRGRATISVTIKGTDIKATCNIIVGTPVSRVKLNRTAASLLVGQSLRLRATVSPKNATTKSVTWKSLNKKVATVSSTGKVNALKKGKAVITATTKDGTGKQALCILTVYKSENTDKDTKSKTTGGSSQSIESNRATEPAKNVESAKAQKNVKVTGITFANANFLLGQGQTAVNAMTVAPSNAYNKNAVFVSDHPEIVSVTQNGAVTALKLGTATITATAADGSGVKGSYTAKVVSKNEKCIQNMLTWAKRYADDDSYGYKKWTSEVNTHRCPVCYPSSGKGWNCIGYISAILYHGGNATSVTCANNGLLTDSWAAYDSMTIDKWKTRNGSTWSLAAKMGEKVSESLLKPGDVVVCYTDKTYKHVLMYAGDGYLFDATTTLGLSKRKYSSVKYTMMAVFRYTGY